MVRMPLVSVEPRALATMSVPGHWSGVYMRVVRPAASNASSDSGTGCLQRTAVQRCTPLARAGRAKEKPRIRSTLSTTCSEPGTAPASGCSPARSNPSMLRDARCGSGAAGSGRIARSNRRTAPAHGRLLTLRGDGRHRPANARRTCRGYHFAAGSFAGRHRDDEARARNPCSALRASSSRSGSPAQRSKQVRINQWADR